MALSHLQRQHFQQTSAQILEAAVAIITEEGEERLTMPAVAERARVGVRTVYRHFGTRAILLEAVWEWLNDEVGLGVVPETPGEIFEMALVRFVRLDERRELVRPFLYRQMGRQGGLRSNSARRAAILGCVRSALANINEDEARRRAAVIEVLISPYAWLILRELWACDGLEAGRAVHEGLQILLGQWNAE